MNYLVHLYLAGESPALRLGGMMGDFVKGPIPAHYPREIALGIHLHRRIDTLAHNSSHTRYSRQKLDPKYRHGRGIIVDIFYDHFLASHWDQFHDTPLSDYSRQTYTLLEEHFAELPQELQRIIPRMIEHDWLYSYRHRDVVGRALQRIAQRLTRPLPLELAVYDLARHEESLLDDFWAFMAEAKEFSYREVGAMLY